MLKKNSEVLPLPNLTRTLFRLSAIFPEFHTERKSKHFCNAASTFESAEYSFLYIIYFPNKNQEQSLERKKESYGFACFHHSKVSTGKAS